MEKTDKKLEKLKLTEIIQTIESVRDADGWEDEQLFKEEQLATTYGMRAMLYFQKNMFEESLTEMNMAIEVYERLISGKKQFDENGLAMVYVGKGLIYQVKGNFELSISDLNKGIKIWERLKKEGKFENENENMLNLAYSIIGSILNESEVTNDEDYADEAISNFNKSVEISEKRRNSDEQVDENALATTYMGMGCSCDIRNKYEEANTYYDKAIEIWENLHKEVVNIDWDNFSKAYMNRGANYYQAENYKKAIADYNKCIGIKEQLEKDGFEQGTFDMVMAYKNRSMAYEFDNNLEAAIKDNIIVLGIIKNVFSELEGLEREELHVTYYDTIYETIKFIELITDEEDKTLLNYIIQDFLLPMRYVPKAEGAEERQNIILKQLNIKEENPQIKNDIFDW